MDLAMNEVMMVGDDPSTDIVGAQLLNIPAVLVGTGKFHHTTQTIPESVTYYLHSASDLRDILMMKGA